MRSKAGKLEKIRAIFRTLYARWGRQHWWPAETPFEVIVGAYLTQNTAWTNVEKALDQLRQAGILSIEGIRQVEPPELEKLVLSAGYFRQKAARLKEFVRFLDRQHGGSLPRMFSQPTEVLRTQLLSLNGIGPETADSILLYAGQHPIFLIDAYTRRILERHGLAKSTAKYDDVRKLVEEALTGCELPVLANIDPGALPKGSCHQPSAMSTADRCTQVQAFNEMHGLIVGVGKNYCLKSKPKCDQCPLEPLLPKRTR